MSDPPSEQESPPSPMGRGGGGVGEHTISAERLPGFVPERKAAYVETMFDTIAPRYDVMNRLMTANLDVGWRRYVVARAAPPVGGRALDVATGTGDIALLLARRVGPR